MLIHKPSNSLIFEHNDPQEILKHIPCARTVNYAGRTLTQVRFRYDEMAVLRNLGVPAPSTIRTEYTWPRNPSLVPMPYNHQIDTADFFTMNRRCICLNGMGTGKTLAAAWAADYLMNIGKVTRAIIVTPRSTLHSAWGDTLLTHFLSHRRTTVLTGSRKRRLDLLAIPSDFYVINHDGLKVIQEELEKRKDINLWILDEAAEGWRNAQTERYKLTKRLLRPGDWVWLMTGTPTPTAPTDAWALAKLINSPTVPKYFNAFRESVMMKINDFKWIPRNGAMDTVYSILQPGIRFRKADCLQLPPVTFVDVACELTAEQERVYAEMQRHLITVADSGEQLVAANAAVKLVKLLQIACGHVYASSGAIADLDCSERLEALETLIASTENKAIVFVPFTHSLNAVAAHLRKRWKVEVVDGSVGDGKRKQIFSDFQNQDDPKVLVAHPKTTAHGLTLTRADLTVWYAPIFMPEIFEQANNRMDRPGQKNNMTVAMLAATAMERRIYASLRAQCSMQQTLLDMYSDLRNTGQIQ